ncbi:hypothetical protein VPNG_03467 [Cytospora leucostoma]|uniref:DUF7726 domain-containing protein n=1 Tax=Cytospora leucostoma TaxID=1230097 RepID=A0A423XGC2_9PEZI|nr:hypothetical protein VPNG_03467 [Cytospora leucostoma]
MQEANLPPPAPAAARQTRRSALRDATARANQLPAKDPPTRNKVLKSSTLTEDENLKEEMAQLRKEAESLRSFYPSIDVGIYINNALINDDTTASSIVTTSKKGVKAPAKTKPTTAKPAGGNSRKRKSETTLEDDIAAYIQDLSDIGWERMPVDLNCDQIRLRINRVIDSGIMKKGEFCDAIGSSHHSVNTFLHKSGPMQGIQSETFTNAWAWFKQRKLAGLKMPDVKKRQKKEAASTAAAPTNETGPPAKKTKASTAGSELPDLSGIHLYREETDSVLVYDTCDEIRKKITAHLKTPGLTQAQFCRGLYAQLHAPKCKGIQSKQLADFRGKKGPVAGATSTVFYAAYVFFEKLRIAKGKPKSAHRHEMEDIYAGRGLDRTYDGRQG